MSEKELGRRRVVIGLPFLADMLQTGKVIEIGGSRVRIIEGVPADAKAYGAFYSWEQNTIELWVTSASWEPDVEPNLVALAQYINVEMESE